MTPELMTVDVYIYGTCVQLFALGLIAGLVRL